MSVKVTPASKRRMNRRDKFVSIMPKPYITIEENGLPVMAISITGLPGQEEECEEILEFIEESLYDLGPLKLKMRMTA